MIEQLTNMIVCIMQVFIIIRFILQTEPVHICELCELWSCRIGLLVYKPNSKIAGILCKIYKKTKCSH